MPLFGFIMWVALKPFRRLTTMVSPNADPFNDAAGALGDASDKAKRWTKRAAGTAAAAYTGGVAAAVTAEALDDDGDEAVPDRAEARPTPVEPLPVASTSSDVTRAGPVAALPASDVPSDPTDDHLRHLRPAARAVAVEVRPRRASPWSGPGRVAAAHADLGGDTAAADRT